MSSLHTRYRPTSLDEVLGQPNAVKMLRGALKEARAHAFLFIGPPGTGKTTLARIAATALAGGSLSPTNVQEVDAATHSGADDMREIAQKSIYPAIGASPIKAIILDEAHRLSSAAWTVLLKPVEEPPKHVFWMFCSTEIGKIPKAIQTRCLRVDLKPVDELILYDLVKVIAGKEGLKVNEEVLEAVAENSLGSPRQALVNLEAVQLCKTAAEARGILRSAGESRELVDFCRFLVGERNKTWPEAVKYLKSLEGGEPESIRIVVVNYVAQALLGAKSEGKARNLLAVLEAFSQPYNQSDKMAPLLLSVGAALNLEG